MSKRAQAWSVGGTSWSGPFPSGSLWCTVVTKYISWRAAQYKWESYILCPSWINTLPVSLGIILECKHCDCLTCITCVSVSPSLSTLPSTHVCNYTQPVSARYSYPCLCLSGPLCVPKSLCALSARLYPCLPLHSSRLHLHGHLSLFRSTFPSVAHIWAFVFISSLLVSTMTLFLFAQASRLELHPEMKF